MGLGDELIAAGQAANVHAADPSKRVAICDYAGRVRWHALWEGNPIIARPEDVARGELVHKITNASRCRPYLHYPFTTETGFRYVQGWHAADHRGRVYLTEDELAIGRNVRETYGPFVLIEPTVKKLQTRNKDWGFLRYAHLVRALPEVTFVRVLHEDRRPLTGAHELGNLTFRQVLAVLSHARAYVGPEGGLHHAAAALETPAVVIFGGCIDPETMGYPEHVNLVDRGPRSPCGRYTPCAHCQAAMARISVAQVARALRALLATRDEGVA